MTPKLYGIRSKPSFNVENFSFLVFGTLACTRMPVHAYACTKYAHVELKNAHVKLEHACTYACRHTHTLGFLWSLVSKKELYFPKNTSSSQFLFDWALNQPRALEFQLHCGMVRVVKCTKCGVYNSRFGVVGFIL